MGLADDQEVMVLDRLYKASIDLSSPRIKAQGEANFSISGGGTVNIHGINASTEPTTLTDLDLSPKGTGIRGVVSFPKIPDYIVITENTATVSEVIASGLLLTNIKAIS